MLLDRPILSSSIDTISTLIISIEISPIKLACALKLPKLSVQNYFPLNLVQQLQIEVQTNDLILQIATAYFDLQQAGA